MRHAVEVAVFVAAALGGSASAQYLMVPDSGAGDRIMLFRQSDGSLVDANWITDIGQPYIFTTPKEAGQVGNEIWVTDQVADAIHRFDLDRNFLGSITTMSNGANLDNIRGFGFDGSKVYVTVFHGTAANRGIAVYSPAGVPTAFFASGTNPSFFDVTFHGDNLLVTNSTTDAMERRSSSDGSFINNFASNMDFVQQGDMLPDGTYIATASIGAIGNEGVYRFNPDGSLHTYINTEVLKIAFGEHVPRAAWLLDDGEYLIATSNGVYKTVNQGVSYTQILAGVDAQYIRPFVIPGPGAAAVIALGAGGFVVRRRR